MEGDYIKTNTWLLPFSWLYGWAVGIRNFLFDIGVLKSRTFHTPVISVGNITVGGTGKTPHVEYLIRLLQDKTKVAVLSRGYKRKTKGFLKATPHSTAHDIGDEPLQMSQKYPKVTVAVDKNRVHGIETLTSEDRELGVILLDDAFQHRYVKPGINILLVDYHRLIIYDKLLPAGRLREPMKSKSRADLVIITKCPDMLTPMNIRVITKAMDLYPYQKMFFTKLGYGDLYPVFHEEQSDTSVSLDTLRNFHTMILSGIASPRQLQEDLGKYCSHLTPLTFPDHHDFTTKDVELINQTFASLPTPRCVITTEKDAVRIKQTEGLSAELKKSLYALPLSIEFMLDQEPIFNEYIIGYVRKNSRNSILAQSKDDHKPQDSNHSGDRPRTISFRNH